MKDVSGTYYRMNPAQYERLAQIIRKDLGLEMPASKLSTLESRLRKRLVYHGLTNYDEYYRLISSEKGAEERKLMLDLATTNKTDFFREPAHFDFLRDRYLPDRSKKSEELKAWSAGCSTGAECVTMAIVLEEFNRLSHRRMSYSILGTDVSPRMIEAAKTAVYRQEMVSRVDYDLLKRYFQRSQDQRHPTVRPKKAVLDKLQYRALNLMDDRYGIEIGSLDVIFFRNVLIYFDRDTQQKLLRHILTYLKPDGLLFLSHTESVFGADLGINKVAPSVFRKQ